jgi:competence protein ComEC
LWSRGVKKIDVVALSHAHEDHLGGLPAVVRNFRIGEFWHGPNAPTPGYEGLLAEVQRRAIPMRLLAAGEHIPLGGASVEILWPPRDHPIGQRPSNDDSVVMDVSSGGASVLLPGDISEQVERELVRSGMPLSNQLLKVAHHGGKNSSSSEFLARVSPSIALVTVEGGNAANLLSPEVLSRLQAAGARTYRTDIAGAVTVELRGSQLSVRAYGTSPTD